MEGCCKTEETESRKRSRHSLRQDRKDTWWIQRVRLGSARCRKMVTSSDLCRLVQNAASALAFLTCCGLASPKGQCPHGHSWSIHSPGCSQRPYFWCRTVLLKKIVASKKKKEKQRCMAKEALSKSSPSSLASTS